jgi:hypothetical protein
MEYVWSTYGTTPRQYGSSALVAPVQVAYEAGQDAPAHYSGWSMPSNR